METTSSAERTSARGKSRRVPATELRIVGGNQALDLCNSRSGPHDGGVDIDALVDASDPVPWALHAGVITEAEAAELASGDGASRAKTAEAVLAGLLDLREATHSVFAALVAGDEPPVEALNGLRRAEATAIARATQIRSGDSYTFMWPVSDRTAIIDRVAHAAAQLLGDGPLSRVKQCAGCSFLFLDESKNSRRRWCSMEDCGREAKMRLYVERRRARAHEEGRFTVTGADGMSAQ